MRLTSISIYYNQLLSFIIDYYRFNRAYVNNRVNRCNRCLFNKLSFFCDLKSIKSPNSRYIVSTVEYNRCNRRSISSVTYQEARP